MNKKYWEVSVWDSMKKLKQLRIPVGQITSEKLQELLRVLTAKHSLTDEETAKCFLRRNARSYSALLEIQRDVDDTSRTMSYLCGENPHCNARIVSQTVPKMPSDLAYKRVRKKSRKSEAASGIAKVSESR